MPRSITKAPSWSQVRDGVARYLETRSNGEIRKRLQKVVPESAQGSGQVATALSGTAPKAQASVTGEPTSLLCRPTRVFTSVHLVHTPCHIRLVSLICFGVHVCVCGRSTVGVQVVECLLIYGDWDLLLEETKTCLGQKGVDMRACTKNELGPLSEAMLKGQTIDERRPLHSPVCTVPCPLVPPLPLGCIYAPCRLGFPLAGMRQLSWPSKRRRSSGI